MGPAPKPAAKRQRRNKRNEVGSIAQLKSDKVVPPASRVWQKRTIEEWQGFWLSDMAALVVKESELSAVRRLFDYRDEHARALRSYRKQRLTMGSTGQQRLSPAFDAMQKLEKMMLPLEDRFAMSSMGRLRMGVELGSAHKSLNEMNASLDAEDDDDDYENETEVIDLPGLPNSR